jgi:hypothetical protein
MVVDTLGAMFSSVLLTSETMHGRDLGLVQSREYKTFWTVGSSTPPWKSRSSRGHHGLHRH